MSEIIEKDIVLPVKTIDVERGVINVPVSDDSDEVFEIDLDTTKARLVATILELYGGVLDQLMAEAAVEQYLAHPNDSPEDILNYVFPPDFFPAEDQEEEDSQQEIEGLVEVPTLQEALVELILEEQKQEDADVQRPESSGGKE